MSGKKLDKEMKSVFSRLERVQREQEEKQYNRHWSEIKVPFTLYEGLSKYTKYELDAIRKNLKVKNASSLKKKELIAVLEERVQLYLKQIPLLWDSERFKLLTNIASNGGYVVAPKLEADQVEYFRAYGLIYTGTLEGEKILAVPDELIKPILSLKNDLKVRAAISRNTEWIKLTQGLLYYYGTLSSRQLISLLEKYTKDTFNFAEYIEIIADAISYHEEVYIDEEGFSNIRVFDPKRVKQEHEMRGNVPFYPFTKQQVLTAGEPGFVDRNKSYKQLVNFFTKHFGMGKEEADGTVEECVYATRIGHGPNDVLTYLSNLLEFDSKETVQAVMDKVVYLMNNTREWFLKGYTSTELSTREKKHLQPLPSSEFNHNDGKKVVKIGRNELCPCGSGKKYKKCCGR
ncbi:SEC-C metal-binding domain-containing protein [Halobacillus hunanensis]|uniref:SEC-C metal-binding domain-containing protein n=1 Tax=Halobacillus hunanensis TaxID=578214 RepID=UPI0009A823CF|nr:SEC-C metal-binding domain-containing protein [Halobacillus hunanensis]